MRTSTITSVTKPFATVAPACPPPRNTSVTVASASNFSAVLNGADLVFQPVASWRVTATAAPAAAVTARPKSRVEGTGVGYAAPAAADLRRGVDEAVRGVPGGMAAGTRFIGTGDTNGKQQDQLHLMSRRDPRTWRPPAD